MHRLRKLRQKMPRRRTALGMTPVLYIETPDLPMLNLEDPVFFPFGG